MISHYLSTENDTLTIAAKLACAMDAGMVIFLEGPLGAGKTTFTRGFLHGLGYTEKVKSPTYTIVEPYEINDRIIYHFDFYRLQSAEELEQIGIRDYFSEEAICLIEWPDKGMPYLPAPDLICSLSFEDVGRALRIEASTERGQRILKRVLPLPPSK